MSAFALDFEAFVSQLPEPRDVSSMIADANSSDTCLIAIVGFEPRCYAALRRLASTASYRPRNVICVQYRQADMQEANSRYLEDFRSAATSLVDPLSQIWISHDDHDLDSDFGDLLTRTLLQNGFDLVGGRTRIVFDITVGSSRLLLEGLHALLQTRTELTILYSEASEYRPSFQEYRSYLEGRLRSDVSTPEFLAHGIDKVALLKRIPGHDADARPTYLAAVPSFTPIRLSAVIEDLAPNRVYWLFGIPHLVRNRWRLDAQREYHSHLLQTLHRYCHVSTFDYREMLIVLEQIYRRHRGEYSFLVCSLGSKMQKLGQALFHILRPEVGAVVSIPKAWEPERYSDENPRAIHVIALGDCADLRDRLWKTRTLRL